MTEDPAERQIAKLRAELSHARMQNALARARLAELERDLVDSLRHGDDTLVSARDMLTIIRGEQIAPKVGS